MSRVTLTPDRLKGAGVFFIRSPFKLMNKIYLISLIIGSLEVAFVTFLTLQSYNSSGWWILAMLAYFIYCFIVGGTLKSVLLLAVMAMFLSISYLHYGFWGAVGIYVLLVLTFELGPLVRGKRRLKQPDPDPDPKTD